MNPKPLNLWIGIVAISTLLVIGCSGSQSGDIGVDNGDETLIPTINDTTQEPSEITLPDRDLTLVSPVSLTPAVSDVPAETLNAMIDDLAQKLNIDIDAISILEARKVVWNDGSLGCPEKGKSYTMAEVPGYYVMLQENGKPHYYHASEASGYFFECENNNAIPVEPNK
jgi:hypothetical protein